MWRLFEVLVWIVVVLAARAILGSVMKGFANSARTGFNQGARGEAPPPPPRSQPKPKEAIAGELHKDPVCGMYVAESTRFQRKMSRDHFYYCSEECKDKHAVAAR